MLFPTSRQDVQRASTHILCSIPKLPSVDHHGKWCMYGRVYICSHVLCFTNVPQTFKTADLGERIRSVLVPLNLMAIVSSPDRFPFALKSLADGA